MGSVYEPTQETPPPEHTRKGKGEKENPTGRKEQLGFLFKRETEHLWLRQPMHGIGRDPFRRA